MENQMAVSLELPPSTIDNNEVEFFSKKSNIWWDEKGGYNGLHTMNKLRLPFVIDCLRNERKIVLTGVNVEQPLQGLEILDVGCGGGILTEALAKKGCKITGVDASSALIKVAKHHASLDSSLSNLSYYATSIEEHAEIFPEKYDVVVCSELIEHVTQQEQLLKSCVKCLKPGGSIFVTTFNKTFMSWWVGIIMSEYILRYTECGTHEWSKFVSPEDVTDMLSRCGCRTNTVRGMKFSLTHFPKKWYWSPNTNIHYALHAVKTD